MVKQMLQILQMKDMIPFKAFQIFGYEPCMQIIIEKNKNNNSFNFNSYIHVA